MLSALDVAQRGLRIILRLTVHWIALEEVDHGVFCPLVNELAILFLKWVLHGENKVASISSACRSWLHCGNSFKPLCYSNSAIGVQINVLTSLLQSLSYWPPRIIQISKLSLLWPSVPTYRWKLTWIESLSHMSKVYCECLCDENKNLLGVQTVGPSASVAYLIMLVCAIQVTTSFVLCSQWLGNKVTLRVDWSLNYPWCAELYQQPFITLLSI